MPPKPKYETPEQMEQVIEDYFQVCEVGKEETWIDKRGEHKTAIMPEQYTIEGLALHLGFKSRQSLTDYANKPGTYADVLSRARAKIVKTLNNRALNGMINDRYCARMVAVIDPGYREAIDVNQTVTHELGSRLAEALQLASVAKRQVLEAQVIKAISEPISEDAVK